MLMTEIGNLICFPCLPSDIAQEVEVIEFLTLYPNQKGVQEQLQDQEDIIEIV